MSGLPEPIADAPVTPDQEATGRPSPEPEASPAELQKLILETADEGFCLFASGDARLIAFNQRFAEIFDFDPDWLATRPDAEDVAAAIYLRQRYKATNSREYLAKVLTRHYQPGDHVMEFELHDGRWITGRTRAAATGERLYTFRNVTAERRVVRELEAERERLSRLVEHAPVAYYVTDCKDGRILEISRSIRNITGKPAAAFMGLSREWENDIHPEDRRLVVPVVRDAVSSRRAFDVEYRYLHADGSVRWLRNMAEPLPDRHGLNPQMAGVIMDITRQKVAENNLRESERRFRELIEGISDLIFYEHDPSRRLTYLSPSVYRVLGYRPEELIGHRFGEFDGPGGDDRLAKAREAVEQAVSTKSRQPQYEVRLRHKSGRDVICEIMEYPVVDDAGRVVGVRGVARDVTAFRDMQRRLRERERLAILGTFAGGLAHDLNNLLLPIRAGLDTLERDPDPERSRRRVEAIRRATDHIGELTGKLLFWTRSESADLATSVVDDVRAWCTSAAEFYRDSVRSGPNQPPVFVDLEIASPPAGAKIDPGLLKQAILNLVLNARDAMPDGGRILIRVERSPDGWNVDPEYAGRRMDPDDPFASLHHEVADTPPGEPIPGCRITVTDQGVGMDESTQERAFDPFFSTKARGKSTGLGLALVARIIGSAGGRIQIRSRLGRGTSIIVDVPALEQRAAERDEPLRRGGLLVGLEDPFAAAFVRSALEPVGLSSRIDAGARPRPGDLVWFIDPARVDPGDARSMLDSLPGLVIVSLAPPDDRPGWPQAILWLDGPVDAAKLRTRVRERLPSE